jgi:hypothetical protein
MKPMAIKLKLQTEFHFNNVQKRLELNMLEKFNGRGLKFLSFIHQVHFIIYLQAK